MWLAVRGLTEDDKAQIHRALSEANYIWVALSVLLGIVAHLSRAVRWKMLFAPMNLHPKLSNIFYAVMIGYLGNLVINRLGEVLRCTILKRYEKIPLTQSFGTVIAERMIDTVVVLMLFSISIWIEYNRLQTYISENIISPLKLRLYSYAENTMLLFLAAGFG
ncbi:MAG: flippase-like domain-containing protein, partial [Nitrospirae bacterium]